MKPILYPTIDQIGPDRLGTLEGGGLDFSYGLLRAVERSLWGHLEVIYLTVEGEGEGAPLLAFTPIYLGSNLNFNALLPTFVQKGYAAMVEHLGVGTAYTVVVVGSLISDRGWIPMHPSLEDRPAVLDLMLQRIDQLARLHRADLCLLKDIHQEYPEGERAQMRAAGFCEGFSLPTIKVDTGVVSFDEYLMTRLTKNGRKHARKQFRKAREAGLSVRAVADFEDWIPRAYPLFRAVFLKARYQFEELPPSFFVECARSRRPETELVICEKDGALAGALLVFFDSGLGEQLDKRIGIDYALPESGLIYNLLNYRGLERAIERGIGTVHLGQSSYLPKTRLGGELTDQYLMVKAYSPALKPSLPLQKMWMTRYRAESVLAGLAEGRSL